MSRNASGTYSLPAGNPVVAGTTIEASWANTTMSDMATEITDSLSRSGKGAMLAALEGYDGLISAPGYTFGSEVDLGMYRKAAATIGFADANADLLILTATLATFLLDVKALGTFLPTGDTAAADPAAFGYAAAEGAILTGQGSTNDVTLKNDADEQALAVLTGTRTVKVGDGTAVAKLVVDVDAASNAYIEFDQAGVVLGYLGHRDTVAALLIDSDYKIELSQGGTARVTISSQGPSIDSGVYLKEAAAESFTPGGGYAELWVRNDAPNNLMFTDDTGNVCLLSSTEAFKTSDESVTSSSTLQDDDELTFSLSSGYVYAFEFALFFTSASATPDFKFQFSDPGGTFNIQYLYWIGANTTGADFAIDESSSARTVAIAANDVAMIVGKGILEPTSSGTFKLQWAQNVSDATAVTLKAGSWMRAKRVA